MSADNGTSPVRASSSFGIWTLLRIAGIIVGVATLLRLARSGLGVEYKEFFQAFLDSIASIVELGFLVDPLEKLIHGALDWVRSFGWLMPELGTHWRPVFMLTWLMMLSFARHLPSATLGTIAWAFACALVAAVAAGLVEVERQAVGYWPLAAYFTFMAPRIIASQGVAWGLIPTFAAVFLTVAGIVFLSPTNSAFGLTVSNPMLAVVVIIVGTMGLLAIASGLLFLGGTLRDRVTGPAAGTGLDILSVIGLALGIGYLMMK